jgi:hypothetical protein
MTNLFYISFAVFIISIVGSFFIFWYKKLQYEKYIFSQKEIINKLLDIENRKGYKIQAFLIELHDWISSSDFSTFVLTTILASPEVTNITNSSPTGLKRLSEALEPSITILKQELVTAIENKLKSITDSIQFELKKEMENESKNMVST